MSTTPNFNLPLLTATQAGKEVTVNQALTLIDAALQAAGTGTGSASSLTAADLTGLFLSQSQLTALLDTELAKLPAPLTQAQLNTALAALPTGATLAQLQAELASLAVPVTQAQLATALAALPTGVTLAQVQSALTTAFAAQPVPATVADVQAAIATIPGGSGGGITLAQLQSTLQATLAALTPTAYSSDYSKLAVVNNTQVKPATNGAYPSLVYAPAVDKFYYMDYGRGFIQFDLTTQTHTVMPNPPLGQPGYTTGAPTLALQPDGKILYAGTQSGTSGATKTCNLFNPAAGVQTWDNSLTYNSAVAQSFGTPFRAGPYTLVYGGTLAGGQIFNETGLAWILPDSYQLPSAYTVDGVSYAGYTGAKSCTLPSGAGLLLLPTSNTAGSSYTSLRITVDITSSVGYGFGDTTATPTGTRFPTNSTCLAVASTSYGAVALVRDRTALTTRFWKFTEATGVWAALQEGLGQVTAAAMARGAADNQVLVITESGSNPGLYLLNAS